MTPKAQALGFAEIVESGTELLEVKSAAPGPRGRLPLTPEMLRDSPSGDIFGLTQNAGMGWDPGELGRPQYLMLSTQGGVRAPDGRPVALGYHTGHWEVGLLMQEAARELARLECLPFAGFVSDPCDGRTQGTVGMMDSLAYRNDAAIVFRRLIRSLPTRKGVMGIATCDKGLPAMMLALAAMRDLPCVLVPGGVTLPPTDGEDAGKVQSIGARFAHGELSLEEASDLGCRACGSPGGGCQFLGTAATSQVIGEALGLSLPHSALAPSGQPIWTDMARRSARALVSLAARGVTASSIVTDAAIRNAMVVHAAFGGSTNLLLHTPAIAHAAGLRRPHIEDWIAVNRRVPRLVDTLPNGPHPTVRAFLAGGVPEVMLQLRRLGLLELSALTVSGETLGRVLDWWETSERRRVLRERLQRATVVDADGVYRKTGPARVFVREKDAIAAIKNPGAGGIKAGDVLVLICRGPLGAGMEEIYQITAALKHLSFGKHVAVITDARFSGVSTGACIGHVGPEALAGGPIGKVRDGDAIRIVVDRNRLEGSIDLVGEGGRAFPPDEGARVLASRPPRPDLSADPEIADDTRLWAALQQAGGGTWGGCVYDVDAIIAALRR